MYSRAIGESESIEKNKHLGTNYINGKKLSTPRLRKKNVFASTFSLSVSTSRWRTLPGSAVQYGDLWLLAHCLPVYEAIVLMK